MRPWSPVLGSDEDLVFPLLATHCLASHAVLLGPAPRAGKGREGQGSRDPGSSSDLASDHGTIAGGPQDSVPQPSWGLWAGHPEAWGQEQAASRCPCCP